MLSDLLNENNKRDKVLTFRDMSHLSYFGGRRTTRKVFEPKEQFGASSS
jgi:hypothetical protein